MITHALVQRGSDSESDHRRWRVPTTTIPALSVGPHDLLSKVATGMCALRVRESEWGRVGAQVIVVRDLVFMCLCTLTIMHNEMKH